MSLFRREPETRAVTSLPWIEGGPLHPSQVTMDRALRLGPVYAAGERLAGSIASLPLQAYQKSGDRRTKIDLPLMFTPSDGSTTLYSWLYRAVTSLAYRGNAVGLVTAWDAMEYPTAVEWLHPEDVQVQDGQFSGPGSFSNPIWYVRGRVVDRRQLLHIPWFVLPAKVWGLSPVGAYAATVKTGLAAQEFSSDWFDSGGVPPGTFKNQNQIINQDDAAIIKKRTVAAIRSHEPLVYGNDWDYSPISIPSSEVSFIDTMKLTATQIAAIYGIPPEMIGGETGHSMTYQNVEQQSINFVQFTLMPWLTRLESAFNAIMPPNRYVKFNVDAMIRTDAAVRMKNYELARMIGKNSINEIRGLEDEAPITGGDDYTPLPIMAGKPVPLPAMRNLRVVDEENEGA